MTREKAVFNILILLINYMDQCITK